MTPANFDFHCHSAVSDGLLPPQEVSQPIYTGPKWEGFDPTVIVIVVPAPQPIYPPGGVGTLPQSTTAAPNAGQQEAIDIVATAIDDLDIVGTRERTRLTRELNQTARPLGPSFPMHRLIEAQAARRPSSPALVAGERRLSYDDLNRQANQVAHGLRRRGLQPGDRVLSLVIADTLFHSHRKEQEGLLAARHSAIVRGPTELRSDGITLDVPDLRAGLAYVMAAALAKGETTITSVQRIERGYGELAVRTKGLSLSLQAF